MSCIDTQDGLPPGSGSTLIANGAWVERYLGNFATAAATDLTVAASSVYIPNTTATPGQSAGATWLSNAGDPVLTARQGAIATFLTNGTTGLRCAGASANNVYNESAQNAPHVHTTWAQLLGEAPRAGADYCLIFRFAAQNINANQQGLGVGMYDLNDGVAPIDLRGNPSPNDAKAVSARLERNQNTGLFGVTCWEGNTTYRQATASRLPVGLDCAGLVIRGSSIIEAAMGVSVGGVLPYPSAMTPVPGDWLGASQTFGTRVYMDPLERVAVFFSTITTPFDATIDAVRVLSRF